MLRRWLVAWYRWKTRRQVRKMARTGEYSTGPEMQLRDGPFTAHEMEYLWRTRMKRR